jgi:hypothetical protein
MNKIKKDSIRNDQKSKLDVKVLLAPFTVTLRIYHDLCRVGEVPLPQHRVAQFSVLLQGLFAVVRQKLGLLSKKRSCLALLSPFIDQMLFSGRIWRAL